MNPKQKWALWAAGTLFLLLYPKLFSIYYANIFVTFAVYALYASSLNLLLGFTGLLSFGHAMYFGTGAYATALALTHIDALPLIPALMVGFMAAAVLALIIAPLVVRVSGHAFAVMHLAFGQLMFVLVLKLRHITGGEDGIGYVPEARRIFPTLTVLDNLMMGVKGGGFDTSDPAAWTIEKIFDHFLFRKDRTHQKGGHLSGGEQQMLTIGRTLMGNPKLLMVDEPTEGLSPIMVRVVRDVFCKISTSGISILLVEHNLKVAMSVAQRVYLMGKAHLDFACTVRELEDNPEAKTKYLEV